MSDLTKKVRKEFEYSSDGVNHIFHSLCYEIETLEQANEKLEQMNIKLLGKWELRYQQCQDFEARVKELEASAMPRELTAENGAKYALSCEFKTEHREICPSCLDELTDDIDDCKLCLGDGYINTEVYVSWTTIKEIYKKVAELFPDSKPDSQEPVSQKDSNKWFEQSTVNENLVGSDLARIKDYMRLAWDIAILPASPQAQEWISVSERLPDDKQRILVYTPNPDLVMNFRTMDGESFKRTAKDATHWQPIAPPKEHEVSDE